MPGSKPKEYWISKGSSKFCDNTITDENLKVCKHTADEFYDLISPMDSIEGGIHVIEMSAFEEAREEVACQHVRIRKLEKRNAGLVEALEESACLTHDNHFDSDTIIYACCIGDALEKHGRISCLQKESPTSSEDGNKPPH